MKTLAKTAIHALTVVGLAGAAITPAIAGELDRTGIQVTYSDLDLSTAKGQKILDNRVAKAARNVCRANNPATGTRIISQEASACLAKARAEAKQQVAALIAEEQRGG